MRGKGKEFLTIMFHPVDGFEQMKYQKTGSVGIATTIAFLWFVVASVERQFTNFRFNAFDVQNTNVIYIFISTFIMFLFFCIANWSLCTLLDGEGTLREIWICTGYALTPMITTMLVTVLLSNVMSVTEGAFIAMANTIGFIWTGLLLFFGMMQIHRYNVKMTVFSIVGSVVGLVLILFLSFLIILLFQQMFAFMKSVYEEIFYRI